MICTLCFTPFDERDSLGSRDGLCQDAGSRLAPRNGGRPWQHSLASMN